MSININLFTKIKPGDLILTVNHRLAHYLKDLIKNSSIDNQPTKHPINILPLQQWLQSCWANIKLQNTHTKSLINSSKTSYLWQKCILKSSYGESILNIEQTAYHAIKAWKLCKQWRIDWHHEDFTQNADAHAFQAWAEQFQIICQENNYIDIDSLPEFIIENLPNHHSLIPQKIYLLGFDEITPQIKILLDELNKYNCIWVEVDTPIKNLHSYQFNAENLEAELYTMARWAFTHYQHGAKNIGCILPNINEIRPQIEAIFNEVITPENILNPTHGKKLYNISVGEKLSQIPCIRSALQLIQLKNIEDIDSISRVLLSAFLPSFDNELQKRAKLDVKLRTLNEKYLYLKQVMLIANQENITDFAAQLSRHIELIENIEATHTFADWGILFTKILENFGWPGITIHNEKIQKISQSLHELFDEYKQLADEKTQISYHSAIRHLQHLCDTYEYNPQNFSAPIQILGTLEASGISFDYLWVTQISDKTWPGPPSPNPFIPLSIQHTYKISRSSAEREFEYCKKLTKRLQNSAKFSVFSYSQLMDEPIKPSPFCKSFPLIEKEQLQLSHLESFAEKIYNLANCEFITDDHGPHITDQEILKGGTAIFKHQAACPFKAFNTLRLHTTNIEQPSLGFQAKDRGIILHEILETTWNTLQSHATLVGYEKSALTQLIQKIVDSALLHFTNKKPLTMQPYFVALEKQRLCKLTLDWLELEKTRPPFSIKSIEKNQTAEFAGIQFKHRTDRIDVLADGSLLIIDYKTGRVTTNHWLGERPQDPQLPLYYLTHPQAVAGITYAQVRSDKKQFKGITQQEVKISGIENYAEKIIGDTNGWDQLIKQWQTGLSKIADEFIQGNASIDPYENEKTCSHCELSLICRIKHTE